MPVLEWLLDSDPSIRWQALRDLVGAPAEVVALERARVATDAWGARLLALRGETANGREARTSRHLGRTTTRTARAYSLLALRDFGADPGDDRVRETVALVGDHCRWEEVPSHTSPARSSPASTA